MKTNDEDLAPLNLLVKKLLNPEKIDPLLFDEIYPYLTTKIGLNLDFNPARISQPESLIHAKRAFVGQLRSELREAQVIHPEDIDIRNQMLREFVQPNY